MLYLRIMLVTAAIGMLVASSAHAQMVPGEASPRGQSLLASFDPFAETIEIQFTPGCDATDHTVYYGPLAMVSTYGYTGALCNVGTGGTATLDALPEDMFFLVVANNGTVESSYGADGAGAQRPEDLVVGSCNLMQDLTALCSPPSLEFEVGPCLETQTTCALDVTGVDADPLDILSFYLAPFSTSGCVGWSAVAYFDPSKPFNAGAPINTTYEPLDTDPDNARLVRLVVDRQALGEFGNLYPYPRKACFAVEDSGGNGINDATTSIEIPVTPVDDAPIAVDWTYASAWENQNIPTTVLFVSSQVNVTNLDNYFFNDQGGDTVAVEIVSLPSTGSLEHEVNGNWVALSVNDRMSCACPPPCSNVDPCNSLQVRYVPGSIVQDTGFSDAFTFKVVDVDTGVTTYAAPGFQNLESAVRTVTFLVGP